MLEATEPIKRTRFTVLKLPKSQRFACSKRDIKMTFPDNVLGWVSLGFIKSFTFDRRHSPYPKFGGPVVARLSAPHRSDGDSTPILCLFPVRVDQYPQSAAEEFKSEILPKMKEWLDCELTRPETAVVGLDECIVVEWTGDQHRCHQFRWR
jgi:hypothetical protein